MFCDGICIKKNRKGDVVKRCGLLLDMKQVLNGPTPGSPAGAENTWQECAFTAIVNGQNTLREASVGVQRSVEHARNQKNVDDGRILEVVAQGMAGIILAAAKDPKVAATLQRMSTVLDEAKKIQDDGNAGKQAIEQGKLPV